ncbi:MAG: hypothetical protein QHI38_05440 [Armatimonadota bacterium]|nr:hypothetical protein [Armatimonadota bacterium]
MRIALLIVVAALSAPICLWAEGKITVDPNAPGAAPNSENTVQKDDRLDQKITYEAKQKTVAEILSDLTLQTGVSMKAGQNSKDWESRDVKMYIFAKDLPLRELMNSMARVMKFRWTREGKTGEFTYRFYMSGRTKMEAESRRLREEEDLRTKSIEKRKKALDSYLAASEANEAELEKLKTENPFLYAVAKANVLQPISRLLAQTPGAVDALITGQRLTIPASALPSDAQALTLQAVQNLWRLESKFSGIERQVPSDLVNRIDRAVININEHFENIQNIRGAGFLLGLMQIRIDEQSVEIPLFDPESKIARLFGKALIASEEQNRPIREMTELFASEEKQIIEDELKKQEGGDPEPEHPDEPILHERFTFKPQDATFAAVLAELAKVTKLSVVSDAYGVVFSIMPSKTGELELKEILDSIAQRYGSNWEKHGSVLEFRDKKWYQKRAALIPQAWIESWRDKLKKTGTLEINDLAQIAELTPDQVTINLSSDEVLSRVNLIGIYFSNRDLLRFYGTLTEDQQTALFSTAGLDLRMLNAEQWNLAQKLIISRNASYLSNPDLPIIMNAEAERVGKQIRYSFRITAEGLDPIKWSFFGPVYVQPETKNAEQKSEGDQSTTPAKRVPPPEEEKERRQGK